MLSLLASLAAGVLYSQILFQEPMAPLAELSTLTAQCGDKEVFIRVISRQGTVGSKVDQVLIGSEPLSNADLQRLDKAIAKRDIISVNVVKCGDKINLDEVDIVFRLAPREGWPTYVGLTISGAEVNIEAV